MVDYIGDPDLARTLSGSPDTTDVTAGQMIEGLKYGHQQLVMFSNLKDDAFSIGAPFYQQKQRIEEHFCASWVKSWWRDPDNKSQELFNRAKTMITSLLENLPTSQASGPSYTSTKYQYRTPALNPNAIRYKSPRVDL